MRCCISVFNQDLCKCCLTDTVCAYLPYHSSVTLIDICTWEGRCDVELEYDVGFDGAGRLEALAVRGWFLCGAVLDLAEGDAQILQSGADQARPWPYQSIHHCK